MDKTGTETPLLADGCAYVTTVNDGHYAIANNDNEILYIGSNGITSVQQHLKRLRPTRTLVNGTSYEAYRIPNSSLVYFIYIRKTKDKQTYFVAIEKTREGHSQDVKAFTGSIEDVQRSVQRVLGRLNESYYVHYVNEAYYLPAVPERQFLKHFEHDKTAIRDALRPYVLAWKE